MTESLEKSSGIDSVGVRKVPFGPENQQYFRGIFTEHCRINSFDVVVITGLTDSKMAKRNFQN